MPDQRHGRGRQCEICRYFDGGLKPRHHCSPSTSCAIGGCCRLSHELLSGTRRLRLERTAAFPVGVAIGRNPATRVPTLVILRAVPTHAIGAGVACESTFPILLFTSVKAFGLCGSFVGVRVAAIVVTRRPDLGTFVAIGGLE